MPMNIGDALKESQASSRRCETRELLALPSLCSAWGLTIPGPRLLKVTASSWREALDPDRGTVHLRSTPFALGISSQGEYGTDSTCNIVLLVFSLKACARSLARAVRRRHLLDPQLAEILNEPMQFLV
jgi:hypothetical protein